MNIKTCLLFFLLAAPLSASAAESVTVLRPARLFDGERMHDDWLIAVAGEK